MGYMNCTAKVLLDIEPVSNENQTCVFGKKFMVQPGPNAVPRLKNKIWSWSGDTYKVVNLHDPDRPIFNVKSKALSWTDKRIVFDFNGFGVDLVPIFMMKEKVMQWGDKQTISSLKKNDQGKLVEDQVIFKVASNCGNTKHVEIDAPGVDMALVLSLVLAYEKIEQSYD
uniref:Tubby C-terminal domain-containing protein n=1 Tax=Chromera velia CCMP2878 TaxID=1169474 RepID=A0A0G4FDV4_9ALVE|eukprot:Cvel_16524.t1-p1 / transcript=Cvel_16524.t1 / gene=Cvel_16524 / organism=Chromera_velia_CCMP2878 / gene_product=hypothetical protein / transcript_product=hypothetical protein / location=Cvel_scaffold1276:4449-5401(+) / protein_length=168 / sequence_SO=supercontig / SO=protein_coding / is_pseudo=false